MMLQKDFDKEFLTMLDCCVEYNTGVDYCVVGLFTNGSRYFSEQLRFPDALERFDKYQSVIEYFGGGTLKIFDKEGNVVKSKHIH